MHSMICLFLGRVNINSKPDFHLSNGLPDEDGIAASMKVSIYEDEIYEVCLFVSFKPDFHLSNGLPGEGAIFLPPADNSARPALFLAAENAILHFLFDLFSRMQYCTFYLVNFL